MELEGEWGKGEESGGKGREVGIGYPLSTPPPSECIVLYKITQVLDQCSNRDVLLFTDGSALTNPGPTDAGAVIYLDGYSTSPILLQKGVSPLSNNYTGELVGIQIGLEFLAETDTVKHKKIHILTDCQSAIRTAFGNELPRNKIEIILDIKNNLSKIRERQNKIKVH